MRAIGQILFKMEGNIGERAKDEIEKLLNSNSKQDIAKIKNFLKRSVPVNTVGVYEQNF